MSEKNHAAAAFLSYVEAGEAAMLRISPLEYTQRKAEFLEEIERLSGPPIVETPEGVKARARKAAGMNSLRAAQKARRANGGWLRET